MPINDTELHLGSLSCNQDSFVPHDDEVEANRQVAAHIDSGERFNKGSLFEKEARTFAESNNLTANRWPKITGEDVFQTESGGEQLVNPSATPITEPGS